MSSQKVLVVGGAGYIGSHTTLCLQDAGYKTVVFDNLTYGHREFVQDGELVVGDTNDTELIESVFEQHDIECVMHFAAYAYVGESVKHPQKYYQNNLGCTLNLLAAMRKYSVNKIVFSSTCATYGIPEQIPIAESHPQVPINPYGASKMMVERILEDYHQAYGLEYVVLRYFNAAGADPKARVGELHKPETHLIPLVLEAADKGTPITIFGADYDTADGTCIRDYIHVGDLALAHKLSMDYLKQNGGGSIFNLGNGKGFSVKQVIEVAEQVTGKSIAVRYSDRREGDPGILVGGADLARQKLGWAPKISQLEKIIETAWRWHQKARN